MRVRRHIRMKIVVRAETWGSARSRERSGHELCVDQLNSGCHAAIRITPEARFYVGRRSSASRLLLASDGEKPANSERESENLRWPSTTPATTSLKSVVTFRSRPS